MTGSSSRTLSTGLIAAGTAENLSGATLDIGTGALVTVREIAETLARIVNPSIAPIFGAIEDRPLETMRVDQHYQTNLRGPYLLTQALLPLLKLRRGQIVFMNSSAGLDARANVAQYAASKHALKAIADSLREEINRDGIRVLSVFPGRTATPMQQQLHVLEGRPYQPGKTPAA